MKMKLAVVLAVAFSACGIAWGQSGGLVFDHPPVKPGSAEWQRQQTNKRQQALLRERQDITNRVYLHYPQPFSPENRIVGGKLYDLKDRAIWKIKEGVCMDVATDGIVVQQFRIEVERVYGPRKSSSAERQGLVIGGYSSPRTVLSAKETKVPTQRVFLKNFPDVRTAAEGKEISVYAMLAGTVDVGGRRLECWDCGLPDTAENRKRGGIPILTPKQVAAAQEEIATALKEFDERSRAAEKEAAEAEAAAEQKAADEEAAKAKVEAERVDAIARANAGKAAALAHLPSFTNQIVTISTLAGLGYTNIALVRASPDGIIYRTPGSAGGGCISYTNLSPDTLETFGIDTNCIAIAQERAEAKAAADAARRATSAQQGGAATVPKPAAQKSLEASFAERYGLKPGRPAPRPQR